MPENILPGYLTYNIVLVDNNLETRQQYLSHPILLTTHSISHMSHHIYPNITKKKIILINKVEIISFPTMNKNPKIVAKKGQNISKSPHSLELLSLQGSSSDWRTATGQWPAARPAPLLGPEEEDWRASPASDSS